MGVCWLRDRVCLLHPPVCADEAVRHDGHAAHRSSWLHRRRDPAQEEGQYAYVLVIVLALRQFIWY